MKSTERVARRHKAGWIQLGVLTLLVASAAPLHAEISPAAIPSTTEHYFSSRPMIAGTVVRVNDHQLVVDTEQGERITLELDSRTMAPSDLAPGMPVRTEFAALENCRFHANRVYPVRAGTSVKRLQAYANTNETGTHVASTAPSYRHAAVQGPGRTRYSANTVQATPGTMDRYYSTHPLIAGTALSVNDHRLVVETDQGRRVAVVMDSRTDVPRELGPGSLVRAEFKRMQDGRFYASRVHVVGAGDLMRVQAYANTVDNDIASAGVIGDCESVTKSPGNSATATVASYQSGSHSNGASSPYGGGSDHGGSSGQAGGSDQYGGSNGAGGSNQVGGSGTNGSGGANGANGSDPGRMQSNGQNGRTGTLPQTASTRPLFLLLALLGLGSGALITYSRRRSA